MPLRKQCPDCKRMFGDDGKRFCQPCRRAFFSQKQKRHRRAGNEATPQGSQYPDSRSIVRKTIDSKDWKRVKRLVIARDGPICQNHRRNGQDLAFSGQYLQCDHIVPQHVRPDLIWELSNLENLCVSCHAIKTNEESGHSKATLRQGYPPLLIDWDIIPNLWIASGHNPRRIEVFKRIASVKHVLTAGEARVRWEAGDHIGSGTLVLCNRSEQFELGRDLRGRYIQFMQGLNV